MCQPSHPARTQTPKSSLSAMDSSSFFKAILALTKRHSAERVCEQQLSNAAMSLLYKKDGTIARSPGNQAGKHPLKALTYDVLAETSRARSRSFEPHENDTYNDKSTAHSFQAAGSRHEIHGGTRPDEPSLSPLQRRKDIDRAPKRIDANPHIPSHRQPQAPRVETRTGSPQRAPCAPTREGASPHRAPERIGASPHSPTHRHSRTPRFGTETRPPLRAPSAPKRKSASPHDAAHRLSQASKVKDILTPPWRANVHKERDEQRPQHPSLKRRKEDRDPEEDTRRPSSRSHTQRIREASSSSERCSHRRSQGIVDS